MEKKCVNGAAEIKKCVNSAVSPDTQGQNNDDFVCNICFNLLYEP